MAAAIQTKQFSRIATLRGYSGTVHDTSPGGSNTASPIREIGDPMVQLIGGLLALFAILFGLADLQVAGAVFGVLTLAWCAVFDAPLSR